MLLGHRMRDGADLYMHLVLCGVVGCHGNVLLLRRIHRIRLDRLEFLSIGSEFELFIAIDLNHVLLV